MNCPGLQIVICTICMIDLGGDPKGLDLQEVTPYRSALNVKSDK